MISFDRDPQQTIPESSVKIIGLGGAGANMLDRAALDGMTGAEMMSVNTDMRTLSSSVAAEKIQIGRNLTKGLGAGGDPELGLKAAQESETEIRDALRDRKIVFLCVGLGGGTGSGAAPLICRIAREEGAFVVVFATMPFSFEGARRRTQAETSLNEIAVISNALVTFDNGRMGELVLAKQGIHEAFAAADRMISESIKAVTRLVVRPGLINVGLDDLMSALSTTRSRCLFGSGIAEGENRSQAALENSLSSPLLDKGSLLADASTVLVHICGGESLTLYEVELLMQELAKHVPATAHILFGAAVVPSMGDSLSVTLVSALPEDKLNPEAREHIAQSKAQPEDAREDEKAIADAVASAELLEAAKEEGMLMSSEEEAVIDEGPFSAVPEESEDSPEKESQPVMHEKIVDSEPNVEEEFESDVHLVESEQEAVEEESQLPEQELVDEFEVDSESEQDSAPEMYAADRKSAEPSQSELELDGGPKGKFEGENPNFHEGEDLDIPPFLRKKRR